MKTLIYVLGLIIFAPLFSLLAILIIATISKWVSDGLEYCLKIIEKYKPEIMYVQTKENKIKVLKYYGLYYVLGWIGLLVFMLISNLF